MTPELHIYTVSGQRLAESAALFCKTLPATGAVALLYTPNRCMLARMEPDGTMTDSAGTAVELASVYEARVFHDKAELRWLNDPSPRQAHRTAVLAAQPYDLGLAETAALITGTIPQRYLLWGKGVRTTGGLANGWSRLAEARIGRLDVPIAGLAQENRVVLHAVEYLAEYDHGNVAVFEERLVRLEVDHG